MLAIVPARAGSKGVPGKNLRAVAGLPLLAHSILFARAAGIERILVSTDSSEIQQVAQRFGAWAPFLRPAELATDTAGMMPVVRHALTESERHAGIEYPWVLLLQPTSPVREVAEFQCACALATQDPALDGVVAVAEYARNPRYVGVEERDGLLRPLFPGTAHDHRQAVPAVWFITGSLYLWRREFLTSRAGDAPDRHRLRPLLVSSAAAVDLDTEQDFDHLDYLIARGKVRFPWAARHEAGS